MMTFNKSLLVLPAFIFGMSTLTAPAADHDGHDHSGHDQSNGKENLTSTDDDSNGFALSKELREEIGLETQMVEMRELADENEAVIAIPESSVFELDGKTYVFAQTEGEDESFKRWEVTLGARNDQFVEAVTGVFPGDTLVSKSTTTVAQIENGTFSRSVLSNLPIEAEPSTAEAKQQAGRESLAEDNLENSCPLNTHCEVTKTDRNRSACDRELRSHHGFYQMPPACETVPSYGGHAHDNPSHFHGYRDHEPHHGYHGHQQDHFYHHGW